MLGLGTGIIKGGIKGIENFGIVTDNLVLNHSNYYAGPVGQISTGAAYFVEGNADYIQVADAAAFTDADGFSIAFWVNFVTLNGDTALVTKHADMGDLDNAGEFYIINDDGICEFVVVDHTNSASIGTKTGTVFTANQWHHVACTHDGGTAATGLLIYIDGVLQAHSANSTGSGFANINDTAQVLRLGAFADAGEPHDGYMCNAGFWSAVLTQDQIKSIMHKNYSGLDASEKTNLVSWWNLDSVIPNSTTLVYDNHHGGGDTLGSELIVNGTMEADANWAAYGSPPAEIQYQSQKYGGNNSWSFTVDAAHEGIYQNLTSSVVRHDTYLVSFFVYPEDNTIMNIEFNDATATITTAITGLTQDAWNHVIRFFTPANSGTGQVRFTSANATSGTWLIDDVSIKKINGNTGTLS